MSWLRSEDIAMREKTFARLKAKGIGVPLVGYKFNPPPMLSPEEQKELREFKRKHREWVESTKPAYQKKGKAKGKYGGLGQKQAAFARALEVRGFNTDNIRNIVREPFIVSFGGTEWSLSKGDEILHTQPFGAGSISIVDQIVSRKGGY